MKKTLTFILALALVFVLSGIPITALAHSGDYQSHQMTYSYWFFGDQTRTITVSAGAGGLIRGSDSGSWTPGGEYTFTAIPDGTHVFGSWSYSGDSDYYDRNGATITIDTGGAPRNYSATANFLVKRTITFDAGDHGTIDGNRTKNVAVGNGLVPAAPAVNANTGWRFTGWDRAIVAATADTTYTAQYVQQFTITFDAGANGKFPSNQQYKYVTLDNGQTPGDPSSQITVNTGYVYSGWNPSPITPATADKTYTAQYNRRSYTVTFDAWDHGTIDGNRTKNVTVLHGDTAAAPTVTPKAGFRFNHWQESIDNITGNKTVHAIYDCITTYYLVHGTIGGQRTVTVLAPDSDGAWDSLFDVYRVEVLDWRTIQTDPGYDFDEWSDWDFNHFDSFHTNEPESVTAEYDYTEYTIKFVSGGHGKFTGNQTSIDTKVPKNGMPVPPTVYPDTGWVHSGWTPTLSAATHNATYTAQYSVATYTVTFNLGSHGTLAPGSAPLTQTVQHGSSATAPTVNVEAGYTLGWDKSFSNVTGSLNVNAVYTPINYTITFNSNGGSNVPAITQAYNTDVTPPADPTRDGYTFAGWNPAVPAKMPLNGTTVTAQWTPISYTITFDSNGGSDVPAITQAFDTVVTPPADPTRDGYTFAGWNPAVPAKMPLNGTTVTAQWTVNDYTITFNSNGGSDVPAITQAFDTVVTPPADPTRDGYTFAGWNPAVPAKMPLNGTTVTAQWTPIDYTITFDSNGGSDVPAITQAFDTVVTPPADPTRDGYTFAGWNPAVPAKMPLNGANLTAQWTPIDYTITFDSNGGSDVPAITQAFDTVVTPPADPTRDGYTFAGWDPAVPAKMPLNGITVTAQWTANPYTITFDSNGGSDVPAITQAFDTVVTPPADPTRDGHTFAGWDPAVPAKMPLNGANLTAQWTINTYKVTYKDHDGTVLKEQTVDWNTDATPPADPSREGHDFTGWDKASTNIKAETVITATYAIKTFTVTFVLAPHGDLATGSPTGLVQTVEYKGSALPPLVDSDPGYTFLGWDVSYDNVTGNITVTARYAINRYTLTVDVQGNGTVAGIAGTYNYGTVINLNNATTTPADGYEFTGFQNANGDPVTSVSMLGNRTVTAVFTAVTVTPQATPTASPAASAAPTQNIPDEQVPQAGPGTNQGQAGGFSMYWLFLIIGLPLIILAILLFFILGKKRRKKEEQA